MYIPTKYHLKLQKKNNIRVANGYCKCADRLFYKKYYFSKPISFEDRWKYGNIVNVYITEVQEFNPDWVAANPDFFISDGVRELNEGLPEEPEMDIQEYLRAIGEL